MRRPLASAFWKRFAILVACSACSSTSVGTGDGGTGAGSSGAGSSGAGSSGAGSSGAGSSGAGSSGDLDPSCRPTEGSYSLSFVLRRGDPQACPTQEPKVETLGPGESFMPTDQGCTVTKDGPCSATSICVENATNRIETTSSFTVAAGGGAATGTIRVRVTAPGTGELKADCEYGVMVIKQ